MWKASLSKCFAPADQVDSGSHSQSCDVRIIKNQTKHQEEPRHQNTATVLDEYQNTTRLLSLVGLFAYAFDVLLCSNHHSDWFIFCRARILFSLMLKRVDIVSRVGSEHSLSLLSKFSTFQVILQVMNVLYCLDSKPKHFHK